MRKEFGLYTASETAGMLLILTVSECDTMVIEKVAFKSGSSKQGNAARASMGYNKQTEMNIRDIPETYTNLEVG